MVAGENPADWVLLHRTSLMSSRILTAYLLGLAATIAGAWLAEVTGSFIPVALGAAFTIVQTVATISVLMAGDEASRAGDKKAAQALPSYR